MLITGCSSGIGYACALGLRDRGYRVFASARADNDVRMLAERGLEAFELAARPEHIKVMLKVAP